MALFDHLLVLSHCLTTCMALCLPFCHRRASVILPLQSTCIRLITTLRIAWTGSLVVHCAPGSCTALQPLELSHRMQDDPPVDSAQRPAVELNAPSPLDHDDPVSPASSRPAGDQDASLTDENGTDGPGGQADEPRERGVGAEEAKRDTNVKVDVEAGNVAAGSQGGMAEAVSSPQMVEKQDKETLAVEEGQAHDPSIESSAGGEQDRKEAVAVDGVVQDATKESETQEDTAASASTPPAPTLVEPKPSNPLTSTSSLLHPPDARSASPATPAGSASSAARAIATSAAGASPAPSVSPGPTSTSAASPQPTKKFQSSLAVNKKFLEKAGEKAKPEVKPVTSASEPFLRLLRVCSTSLPCSSPRHAARPSTFLNLSPSPLCRQALLRTDHPLHLVFRRRRRMEQEVDCTYPFDRCVSARRPCFSSGCWKHRERIGTRKGRSGLGCSQIDAAYAVRSEDGERLPDGGRSGAWCVAVFVCANCTCSR